LPSQRPWFEARLLVKAKRNAKPTRVNSVKQNAWWLAVFVMAASVCKVSTLGWTLRAEARFNGL